MLQDEVAALTLQPSSLNEVKNVVHAASDVLAGSLRAPMMKKWL